MAKQVVWNKPILDEFIKLAELNNDEIEIMRTRMQGMTRTEQARNLGMSLSTIDRIISRLKIKYDSVQPFSDILPQRKFSAKETYMDSH